MDGVFVVVGKNDRVLRECGGNASAVGIAERQRAGTGFDQQRVSVAVIAAVELNDLVAFGKTAGEANGGHAGLGAGIAHAHFFNARDGLAHELGHCDFERIRDAKAGPALCGVSDGFDDFRMGVAENRWAPGADVINVVIAVDIEHVCAADSIGEKRCAADAAKSAHRRVNAAGNVFLRFGEKLFGFSVGTTWRHS